MQIKLFTIPITDNGVFIEEMNRFLRANKILEVENQLVSNERGASWCFCVKYIAGSTAYQKAEIIKKDYKSELDEHTFKIFSKLRELRKQLAQEDAVPAYAVCTDQELSEIASLKVMDEKGLKSVKGFGDKKFDRYGKKIIEWSKTNLTNETSGQHL